MTVVYHKGSIGGAQGPGPEHWARPHEGLCWGLFPQGLARAISAQLVTISERRRTSCSHVF